MARITVEGCLDKVQSRFELILLASVALREIEEGLITKEILDKTLEEDLLLDEFAIDREKPQQENIG